MTKVRKLKRVIIKEELVALTGKVEHAIVLNQFIYWSERIKDVDNYLKEEMERVRKFSDGSIENTEEIKETLSNGWIYKTAEEMKDECMFEKSVTTMERIIKDLVDKGWIDRRRNPKYKWDKTYQYRVNIVKIQHDLLQLGYSLEGYSLGDFLEDTHDDSKLQNEGSNLQNDDSNLQNEASILQNDDSKLQNEASKLQNEGAIPEITTETTSDNIVSIVNKETMKYVFENICHKFYPEFAPGRWTKKQWMKLIDKFTDELIDNKVYEIVPKERWENYILGALRKMAHHVDFRNPEYRANLFNNMPTTNHVPLYNWLDERDMVEDEDDEPF